jgi:transcriptional regulator with GAF, ATPase, and Fis domain
MKRIYDDAIRAAAANVPVLVLGETGVGKEHVARTLHRESPRRDHPFVAVNCAAIPASLLESTLFGHERGAFTGASARAMGVFERANGGVLFLDEIGDLGSGAQVALLRAIEARRISRVGSSLEIPVDVRIVAATHCDLEAMIEEGTFRQDLYYRLNGISLEVPPLRERQDEIEPLVRQFLLQARRDWGLRLRDVTPEAMAHLQRCECPGNVRPLRCAVKSEALLASWTIGIEDFGLRHNRCKASRRPGGKPRPRACAEAPAPALRAYAHREALRRAGINRRRRSYSDSASHALPRSGRHKLCGSRRDET